MTALWLTPPIVATKYGIKPATVLSWIRAGELKAINLAKRTASRPRYRIDPVELALFEQRRAAVQAPQASPLRRPKNPKVIEFF